MKPGQFLRTHCFKGMAEGHISPGLHLGDDQGVAVKGDDVYFAFSAPPIAIDNLHSLAFKKCSGHAFAFAAKNVLCSHEHHLRHQAFRRAAAEGSS